MHILFVDDSRATALPAIAFLEQQGYHVTFVQDGAAAVAAFQADPPDQVLMDVVMPEMDGIEATRRMKALGGRRWVPVVLMTSLTATEGGTTPACRWCSGWDERRNTATRKPTATSCA